MNYSFGTKKYSASKISRKFMFCVFVTSVTQCLLFTDFLLMLPLLMSLSAREPGKAGSISEFIFWIIFLVSTVVFFSTAHRSGSNRRNPFSKTRFAPVAARLPLNQQSDMGTNQRTGGKQKRSKKVGNSLQLCRNPNVHKKL